MLSKVSNKQNKLRYTEHGSNIKNTFSLTQMILIFISSNISVYKIEIKVHSWWPPDITC